MPRRKTWGVLVGLGWLAGGSAGYPQDEGRLPVPATVPAKTPLLRNWEEGVPLRIRVPVATPAREVMSAVAFPETGIQAAITGWGPSTLTAIQRGNILFLRLGQKTAGQISAIGDSGTHYLLYLEAADPEKADSYDAYVKIVRPGAETAKPAPKPREGTAERGKPKGALELIRAMRQGESREGTRILRAKSEVLYSGNDIELRLLYVYEESSFVGRIYEVRNLAARKLALDASRFRAAEGVLILSALRENVIPPGGVSRLYTVYWRP